MKQLTLRCFAKINIGLDVHAVESHGYHLISTIFSTINLADTIELKKADKISLEIFGGTSGIPIGEQPFWDNSVFHAWAAVNRRTGKELKFDASLVKEIPVGSGLGGASTDAAGMIVGLNKLFDLGLSDKDMVRCGDEVGADVPFLLRGGLALGAGCGEVLTYADSAPDLSGIILRMPFASSTREAYAWLDAHSGQYPTWKRGSPIPVSDAIRGAFDALSAGVDAPTSLASHPIGNVFLGYQRSRDIRTDAYLHALQEMGAYFASVTGTGSALFGLFEKPPSIAEVRRKLMSLAKPNIIPFSMKSVAASPQIIPA
jgi:4-diphosphocytidyl-2-C-methyl-D-erythritol kinase